MREEDMFLLTGLTVTVVGLVSLFAYNALGLMMQQSDDWA